LADRSLPPAFRSVILEEAGSTNTEAFKRALAGEPGPLWVMARRQTQGRGRSGRQWASEPGNLYASLLQRLACSQKVVHQLSLLAGVAAVEAIAAAAGGPIPGLRLKWPNDVLIGEAKCAGILPETQMWAGSLAAGSEVIVVIGIGINLASHPEGLGRAVTHLAAHGVSLAPEAMLAHLAGAMDRWLRVWDCGAGFAQVRAAWLGCAGAAGESITVDTGRERVAGTFLGLDDGGALMIRDAQGQSRKLTFGDVTLAHAGARERG
jgi:BirA family transcriptional regulator, biotin operon repressor / biotin---[acetyl-CoA-carboxylase] ligase